MSARFSFVPIFNIVIVPFLVWSWKWWNLREICLVLGLKGVSEVASTIQALLSSNILEGGRIWESILSVVVLAFKEMKLFSWMSVRMQQSGIRSRVAVDNAINSLSVVERAISLCNLLHQMIGQLQNVITNPVQDKTLSHNSVYSWCQRPAKSASTYMLRCMSVVGRKINPLCCVVSRYLVKRFTANSWMAFGWEQNCAHWCTATLISGRVLFTK